ncbi:6-phosphofructokinase [Treponema berlinense]|uniref:6-phosphofructokinase n=1 Tax=Treponema berlinense TaxID=225004 RepID=UPI0026F106E0|nr:ATP-dependent 6-phosphofructokinase [Treponema berlinense]
MKVGILTSGGDCQALNATMRGVAKTLFNKCPDVKIIGIEDGYKGMIYGRFHEMSQDDFSGILTKGGTILGTAREPFKHIREIGEDGLDKVKAMEDFYRRNGLDCLVVLGGNGSLKTASLLSSQGLNVVALPKTIDNDIFGTDMTFGFMSAVDVAVNAIDCIHTTAASHSRVFIVEVMGHKTGHLALNAGIAGGADIILLPEIPYRIEKIISKIDEREKSGHHFTIVVAAEGALSIDDLRLPKKQLRLRREKMPVSFELSAQIRLMSGKDVRVTIPGHTQRGGSPDAYDRILSSRLGAAAAGFIIEKKFGVMAALTGSSITAVPLSDVAGKLKNVDILSDEIAEARSLGICFGD